MWHRPLLVAFYIAAADVQCEGAMLGWGWGTRMSRCQGPYFSPKGTHFRGFLEHIHSTTHPGVCATVEVPGSRTWIFGVPSLLLVL